MEIQGLVDAATVSGPRASPQLTRLTHHQAPDATQVQSQTARMLIPAPLHPGCVNSGLHFHICPMAMNGTPLRGWTIHYGIGQIFLSQALLQAGMKHQKQW